MVDLTFVMIFGGSEPFHSRASASAINYILGSCSITTVSSKASTGRLGSLSSQFNSSIIESAVGSSSSTALV
jgi:hypothetical protein